MSRFPMSVDLTGKRVYLIGDGEQIRQKARKLEPFGPVLCYAEDFTQAEADSLPAMVIVGDTEPAKAQRISSLCQRCRIPVNVVDMPALCSFYFPALIVREPLTVALTTDGCAPAAAGYLRGRLEEALPENTEQILAWLGEHTPQLRRQKLLTATVAEAFRKNRPLTQSELDALSRQPE